MTIGIDIAKQYLGLQEIRDKTKIQKFLASQAHAGDIAIDPSQISWCAAFVNACERSVGNPGTGRLNARSFLTYGQSTFNGAQEGDIVIFDFEHDGIHGHVSYFMEWDDVNNTVKCLGGNQHNSVNESNYIQDYIVDIRRFP